MFLNFHSKKSTIMDGVNTHTREETGTFEITAVMSKPEQNAIAKTAQLLERIHTMDGERMGWITTLLDKIKLIMDMATEWQKAKLERDKVALELAKLKIRGQD